MTAAGALTGSLTALLLVCRDCNQRTERERPWLMERGATGGSPDCHNWSHALVWCPAWPTQPPPKCKDTGGVANTETLSSVRARLGEQSAQLTNLGGTVSAIEGRMGKLEARMEKLEVLLSRLVDVSGR